MTTSFAPSASWPWTTLLALPLLTTAAAPARAQACGDALVSSSVTAGGVLVGTSCANSQAASEGEAELVYYVPSGAGGPRLVCTFDEAGNDEGFNWMEHQPGTGAVVLFQQDGLARLYALTDLISGNASPAALDTTDVTFGLDESAVIRDVYRQEGTGCMFVLCEDEGGFTEIRRVTVTQNPGGGLGQLTAIDYFANATSGEYLNAEQPGAITTVTDSNELWLAYAVDAIAGQGPHLARVAPDGTLDDREAFVGLEPVLSMDLGRPNLTDLVMVGTPAGPTIPNAPPCSNGQANYATKILGTATSITPQKYDIGLLEIVQVRGSLNAPSPDGSWDDLLYLYNRVNSWSLERSEVAQCTGNGLGTRTNQQAFCMSQVYNDQFPATAFFHNGTGFNLDLLGATPVIIGQDWQATVLPQDDRGPGTWWLLVRDSAASTFVDMGVFLSLPPAGESELLVGSGVIFDYTQGLPGHGGGGTSATFTVAIPPSCSLVGRDWFAQAVVFGDLPSGAGNFDPWLSSSMRGTVGTF